MSPSNDRLHLAVSLEGAGRHPAAWRDKDARPQRLFTADYLLGLVQEAERGGLDFVTLEDSLSLQSPRSDRVRGHLDALLALARVAPLTKAIGLVPVVTTTHTEPFHISKNVATLDFVSLGRAGWKVAVSATETEARMFGRKPVAPPAELYEEASDVIDVVARLWDSWEDDAVIRDVPSGRYVDRAKLHYVDFEGKYFSVRGPSITPRPPQGHPLVVMDATSDEATGVAAGRADIVLIEAGDPAAARRVREDIRTRAEAAGRRPDTVTVLATIDVLLDTHEGDAHAQRARLGALTEGDARTGALDYVGTPEHLACLLEEWFRDGTVDGFIVRPALLPKGLSQLVDQVVPMLEARGLFHRSYAGRTLRDHFGLERPSNRYAVPV